MRSNFRKYEKTSRGLANPRLHCFWKGVYHLAGGGFTSRYEWTKAIVDYLPGDVPTIVKTINPAKTSDFPSAAKRPLFSALDCSKFESTFSLKIPKWEIATKLMLSN
jgi:dTDP-4-dehydrorhamnose reductase